jgi:hypothetical protein
MLGIAQRHIRIKFSQKMRKQKYDSSLPASIKTVADRIQGKRREKNQRPAVWQPAGAVPDENGH